MSAVCIALQQYWVSTLEPYRYVTVAEFAERFRKFHVGKAITDHLTTPLLISEVATKGHSGQEEVPLLHAVTLLEQSHASTLGMGLHLPGRFALHMF